MFPFPASPLCPAARCRVTFDGLYRGINKVSGVFNPTDLNVTYTTADGKRLRAGIAQYTQMDNAAVEFTIPKDIKFEDGADSANFVLSDGHISGNMYCASNPFNFMYEMTDQGMPTNFAALLLRMLSSHLMDISIPVQKLTYDVRICARGSRRQCHRRGGSDADKQRRHGVYRRKRHLQGPAL